MGEGFHDVHKNEVEAVTSIMPAPRSLDDASEGAAEMLATAVEEALRLMQVGVKVFRS